MRWSGPRAAYEKRELHVTDIAGTSKVRVHGLLDRAGAAHLRAALDPLSTPHPTEDGPDPRTAAQRRADALVEVCQLANACGELPENGGDRPQVVVTIDYQQLRDGVRAKRGAGVLDTGTQLSPGEVRLLACDGEVLPVTLDGASQVLDVGRERRLISGSLRRALVVRDKGCAFPGCGRPPRWCQRSSRRALGRRWPHETGEQHPPMWTAPSPHPPQRLQIRMKDGHPVFVPPDG